MWYFILYWIGLTGKRWTCKVDNSFFSFWGCFSYELWVKKIILFSDTLCLTIDSCSTHANIIFFIVKYFYHQEQLVLEASFLVSDVLTYLLLMLYLIVIFYCIPISLCLIIFYHPVLFFFVGIADNTLDCISM